MMWLSHRSPASPLEAEGLTLWNLPSVSIQTLVCILVGLLIMAMLLMPLPMHTNLIAHGRLVVDPPLITAVASQAGRVDRIEVHEGQQVRAAQDLVHIQSHADRSDAQRQQLRQHWQQWLKLLQQQRQQADQQLMRMTPLWARRGMMDAEYRQYQQRQQQLWQTWLQAQHDYAHWQRDEELSVPAPEPALVEHILVQPSQWVSEGTPLMKLKPQDAVWRAELIIPNTSIRWIHPRQRVIMRMHAYPFQQFGVWEGEILKKSTMLLDSKDLSADRKKQDGGYRLYVSFRPTSKQQARLTLLHGMSMDASILTHTCPLWQWLRHLSCIQ